MTSISVTALRQDIYNIINRVNEDCAPVSITNSRGKGAVLIGEDDWAAIEETLYLMSIPDMTEPILAGKAEPVENCIFEDDLEW